MPSRPAAVLTNLALTVLACSAFLIPAATADAPEGGWVGFDSVTDREPLAPKWSDVTRPEDFPGCHTLTGAATIADRVVIFEDGDVQRLTFGEVAAQTK